MFLKRKQEKTDATNKQAPRRLKTDRALVQGGGFRAKPDPKPLFHDRKYLIENIQSTIPKRPR
jgi:hypothetical protein